MKSEISFALILVAIFAVGTLFLFNKNKPTPDLTTPEQTSSETQVDRVLQTHFVTYSQEGFSPKDTTIQQGDTVVFTNESDSRMWVASAQHPTHNNYPEKSLTDCLGSSFDQCLATRSWHNLGIHI